jgi:hypothetical protein
VDAPIGELIRTAEAGDPDAASALFADSALSYGVGSDHPRTKDAARLLAAISTPR